MSSSDETCPSPALFASDGSAFVPSKSCFPPFNWDVVPQYFMFCDKELLPPDQVQSIASRTDFIAIEKGHCHRHPVIKYVDVGTKLEINAFREVKPGIKALFYFNTAYAWPFTKCTSVFRPKVIDNHPKLKSILLTDPKTGEPLFCERRRTFCFDVLKPEMRRWWVHIVAKCVAETGSDGVFCDQCHGFSWVRPDKSDEVKRAMGDLFASLQARLGADKIILGNNAQNEQGIYAFPHVDAFMFEHYNAELLSKENLFNDWKEMLRISKEGKVSVFRVGVCHCPKCPQGPMGEDGKCCKASAEQLAEYSETVLEFYLGCFLIGAQPYSYFQYGWGWQIHDGPLKVFPLLGKSPGPPLGPYERTSPNGWEFTREFQNASVLVDTEHRTSKITWRDD